MKPLLLYASFLSFGLLLFSSCKKDKEEVKPPLSRTEMITSGSWKIIAFTLSPPMDFDGDGTLDSDAYATYQPCTKDNYFVFKQGGEMEVNQGATKCYSWDNQIETLSWSFEQNETVIIIESEVWKIHEFSEKQFRISGYMNGTTTGMITFSNL
jgi:hypothetical protein